MPSDVKRRKKIQTPNDEATEKNDNEEENDKKETVKAGSSQSSSSLDLKSLLCFLSLAACGALSWVTLQQNERFSQMEEKYMSLQGRTSSLFDMEQEVLKVSKKCEAVQLMLQGLEGQQGALRPQLQALEQDGARLQEWSSGLMEKRAQMQSSLDGLQDAVGQIQERTAAISVDFANKVAAVRTDVRRMDGLHSEMESVLAQVGELEDKTAQVERNMVKRIGDVLAGSIERVSNLRSASERNSQTLDQLRRRLPELAAADQQISERLRELESSRARIIRTVTFASDLKPKVASIKRDFQAMEPLLSDLTLRIGRLAEDLMKREEEIAELRQTLSNLTAVEGDLNVTSQHVSDIAGLSDV